MKVDRARLRECLDSSDSLNASERAIYNPLAYAMGLGLLHTRITPNQLTCAWGLVMLLASVGFYFGNYCLNIVCGAAWVVAYAMDCADGPLARYTGMKSARGDYLDSVNHRATYPLMMFFVGYSAMMWGRTDYFGLKIDPIAYLILGACAGVSMVLIIDLGNIYNRVCPESAFHSNKGSVAVEGRNVKNRELYVRVMMFNPAAFTNMIAILPICAALDALDAFIIFYGLAYTIGMFGRYVIFLRMIPGVREE